LAPSALVANGASLAAAAAGVSDAEPVAYFVNYPYHVSDQVASGPQLAHIVGVFVFVCEGTDQYLVMTVPAIKVDTITIITPGLEIDTTLAIVQSLVDTVIANNICNPFGYRAISLQSAFWQFVP
jgi:hypothetical protein